MEDPPKREIRLFYCYARSDKPIRDKLEKHITTLNRHYHLTHWHDREILPGKEWEHEIHVHLDIADIVLLLISHSFMTSDYCYGIEMKRALERHKEGTCRVIPILLSPTYWQSAPFSTLQLLPRNTKPITSWRHREQAFDDIVKEISNTIEDLLASLTIKEESLDVQFEDINAGYYQRKDLTPISPEETLAAYEQAIQLDPNNAENYYWKGMFLLVHRHDEEALAALEQAIQLDPNNAENYIWEKHLLIDLERYEEALAACEHTIQLDPNNAENYSDKALILRNLKRYEEALAAYEHAIQLDPNNAENYHWKGVTLLYLGRDEEADQAFRREQIL